MKPYNPGNWYWLVGTDETRVYSGATGNYVPVSDPAFQQWSRDGTRPTRIDTEANLGRVLAPYRLRPIHSGILDGYLEQQADEVVDALQFKLLFNHENRIRAIERALNLNGSPPNLGPAQARTAVMALL